jgi:hypothetical protein
MDKARTRGATAFLAAVALGMSLAACGGSKKIENVADLRDAAVNAGYACPSWVQDNKVVAAAQSGTCSGKDVFATYLSEAERDRGIANLKQFASQFDIKLVVLVGPNWSINSDEAPKLQSTLGGTIVNLGS